MLISINSLTASASLYVLVHNYWQVTSPSNNSTVKCIHSTPQDKCVVQAYRLSVRNLNGVVGLTERLI